MTVYVDSSVLLRFVFGERRQLREWPAITRAVSSTLVRLECLRVIDRARLRSRLPDPVIADMHETAQRHLAGFDLVPLDAAPSLAPNGRVTGIHYRGEWTDVGTPQRLAQLDAGLRSVEG